MKLDISLGLLVLEKLYLLAGLRGMPLCLTSKICFGLNRSHWGGIAPTIPVCMSVIFMLHYVLSYSLIQPLNSVNFHSSEN